MTGEFTTYCNHYYRLTVTLAAQQQSLDNLLDNAPHYNGETMLSDIDAIIRYYREAQAANAEVKKTTDDLHKTAGTILMIMQHFEIPAGTLLTGQIPGELQYKLWADEHDNIHIKKTKDLAPQAEEENVIVIRLIGKDG